MTTSAAAADKVVIIPMGEAVGDATSSDVIQGKTFSSEAGKGLTGTLVQRPELIGMTGTDEVLEGKIFSSKLGDNLTGDMPYVGWIGIEPGMTNQ